MVGEERQDESKWNILLFFQLNKKKYSAKCPPFFIHFVFHQASVLLFQSVFPGLRFLLALHVWQYIVH